MVEHDACASEVIEEIGKHNSKPAQKRKPLSDEAKHLTRELQDALKRQGQSTFARDWFLTSASSAQALLNGGKSLEQIREVMRWALSEWACRQSITHFAHVAKAFPHFERQHATASSSLSDADPRIARIDRLMSCESIQNRLTGDILATAQLVRPLPFLLRHGGIELDVFEWEGVRHE